MQTAGKNLLKRLCYPLYHRVRNRETLTVVMFHRVLSSSDPRWESADPDWTVSDDVFAACLRFFRRNYNVVRLEDLLGSLHDGRLLPARSLLITFDDGYADNEEYALPILRRYRLPAALFMYSDAIGSRIRPWAEELQTAYRRGRVSPQECAAIYGVVYPGIGGPPVPADPAALMTAVLEGANQLTPPEVEAVLSMMRDPVELRSGGGPPQMLSAAQLRHLHSNDIAIGAHGKTHTALTRARDLDSELREPRRVLAETLSLDSPRAVRTLAFPYGAYDPRVLEHATREGYELVFTIRPEITMLARRRLTSSVLGRINVHGPTVAPDGVPKYEQLAHVFFRAPHVRLDAPQ